MNANIWKVDKFEEINYGETIKLGNGVPSTVKGRGSLILNDKIKCYDVYWVQGLKYNLLSVSQLNNLHQNLEFKNRKVKIFDDKGNILGTRGKNKANLFYLDPTVETHSF